MKLITRTRKDDAERSKHSPICDICGKNLYDNYIECFIKVFGKTVCVRCIMNTLLKDTQDEIDRRIKNERGNSNGEQE